MWQHPAPRVTAAGTPSRMKCAPSYVLQPKTLAIPSVGGPLAAPVGAMWSEPPPIAAMAPAALAAVQEALGMVAALYSHAKGIVNKYPWQCVLMLAIAAAVCMGAYIAWRYANSRMGARGLYTHVAPEPEEGTATPATTAGRCATTQAMVHSLLTALVVAISIASVAFTWVAWEPLPFCPRAGDVQSWWSAGAWQAVIGGLVAVCSLYGCYEVIARAPEVKDRR